MAIISIDDSGLRLWSRWFRDPILTVGWQEIGGFGVGVRPDDRRFGCIDVSTDRGVLQFAPGRRGWEFAPIRDDAALHALADALAERRPRG